MRRVPDGRPSIPRRSCRKCRLGSASNPNITAAGACARWPRISNCRPALCIKCWSPGTCSLIGFAPDTLRLDQRTCETSTHHRGHQTISGCPPAQASETTPQSRCRPQGHYYKELTGRCTSLGTRFFAHKSRAGCQTAPESPAHLQAKFIIAESATAAGWQASTEESGIDPDGNPWIADVLCTRRKTKVAFEVQLAAQSLDEIRARQEQYRQSGIRCLWLIKLRGRRSAIQSYPPCRDLPMVLLDVREP